MKRHLDTDLERDLDRDLDRHSERVLATAFHGALDPDFHTDVGKVFNEHLDWDIGMDLNCDLHGNGSGSGCGFAQGPG